MTRGIVTGVGGGVGQSIIKSLQGTDYEVVGVDSEPLAAGLYATNLAYIGEYANHNSYIDRLLEIAKETESKFIFPGHDVELDVLAKNKELFENNGILPIVSNPEVINICDDKYATYKFLNEHDFPVPHTQLLQDADYTEPVIIKPRCGGARSKNVYFVDSAEKFYRLQSTLHSKDYIVQEYIEGDEYTCGSVTMGNKCHGTIVMKRILRDGDTYKAFVEHPSSLEGYVKQVVEALKPFGACNVQLRVKNDIPYIFEINARCSGTTGARALAGFNEPKMILDYIINQKIPEYTIKNISILRYWKELVVDNDSITRMQEKKYSVWRMGLL